MNLALQASVSSAPGLGGGRGERGLRGEAMVVLPCWLGRRRRGDASLPAAGLVDGVRGREFGLSLLSFELGSGSRARAAIFDALSARLFWTAEYG